MRSVHSRRAVPTQRSAKAFALGHFTPTYGSWMNLVERWLCALTTKKLQALAADIRAWVDAWNEDPKPFVWHKTAEQISNALLATVQP
jgi:hypothetical protein